MKKDKLWNYQHACSLTGRKQDEKRKKKTGTDHQLQHKQWKSLIASHFRLKKEKEKGNENEFRVYITRKNDTDDARKNIHNFFHLFLFF